MRLIRQILAAITALLAAALCVRADNGRVEISQSLIPYVITNSGSYLVTEDLTVTSGVLVPAGSTWKYLDNGSNQGTAWTATNFDDSAWASGPAELGYGDLGVEATTVSYGPSSSSKYITTYFRKAFFVTNLAGIVEIQFFVRRDDGIVVYLNGSEVIRDNMPGSSTYTTLASSEIADGSAGGDGEATYYPFIVPLANLKNGTNVIAAEIHQASASGPDISFDLALLGYAPGQDHPTNAITIAADNVTLDLGGHVLAGTPVGTASGIYISRGSDITLRNGTITLWGENGITALNTTNVTVRDIALIKNFNDGIDIGAAAHIRDCMIVENGRAQSYFERGNGIRTPDENAIITGTISRRNYNHGILISSGGYVITDCTLSGNSHDQIHAGQAGIVTRNLCYASILAADNKRGEGMQVEWGTLVSESTLRANDDGLDVFSGYHGCLFHRVNSIGNLTGSGIKLENGSVAAYCNAYANGGSSGIKAGTACLIYNCTAQKQTAGGAAGITLTGTRNAVIGNHTAANTIGINATATGNLILRNTATANGTAYSVTAGNLAPFATNALPATAWPNIRY